MLLYLEQQLGRNFPRLFVPEGPRPGKESTNLRIPPVITNDPALLVKVAVATAPLARGLGSLKVTVGAEVYPVPGFVSVKAITTPCETLAVAVAPVPPPPVRTTCGVVYPDPPLVTENPLRVTPATGVQ